MAAYRWKRSARVGVSAEVAGSVMDRLSRGGRLTPAALVDASRAENAPLHGEFEWDDGVAAERYRQTQAGYLIRSIEVVVEQAHEPVRAYLPVHVDDDAGYVPIQTVMESPRLMNEALLNAKRELASFRRKYSQLAELAGVMRAIDEVTGNE